MAGNDGVPDCSAASSGMAGLREVCYRGKADASRPDGRRIAGAAGMTSCKQAVFPLCRLVPALVIGAGPAQAVETVVTARACPGWSRRGKLPAVVSRTCPRLAPRGYGQLTLPSGCRETAGSPASRCPELAVGDTTGARRMRPVSSSLGFLDDHRLRGCLPRPRRLELHHRPEQRRRRLRELTGSGVGRGTSTGKRRCLPRRAGPGVSTRP